MIRYDELNLHVEFGKLLHVISDHAREMYGDQSNLDVSHMSAAIAANIVRGYVVYKGDEIAGYALFMLSRDLFKAHIRTAECVAVFINKAHRNGVVASRLLAFSSMRLEHEGVNQLIITANNSERLANYYARLGFKKCNIQMVKEMQ